LAHAWRRARGDDVARFQGHELRQVADDLRDGENHGLRIAGLHALAIDFQVQVQVLLVDDFVARDQPRTDGAEGVAALALIPLAAPLQLERAFGNVVDDAIAGHVFQCVRFAHVLCPRTDDDAQFHFPVRLFRAFRQHDIVVGTIQAADRLHEDDGLGRDRHARLGRVVRVIETDADELADLGQRHAKAGIAAHQGQHLFVELGQLAQGLVGQLRAVNIGNHAGQVAQFAFFIDQARFFLAWTSITNEFHSLPWS